MKGGFLHVAKYTLVTQKICTTENIEDTEIKLTISFVLHTRCRSITNDCAQSFSVFPVSSVVNISIVAQSKTPHVRYVKVKNTL
jgi:hypothetical protein